jgi:hypothetical protein
LNWAQYQINHDIEMRYNSNSEKLIPILNSVLQYRYPHGILGY